MLRKRKNRRYNEETNDDDGDGERKFDILEQIKSQRFEPVKEKHLLELLGKDVTLKRIQRDGFEKPILVVQSDGLDLRVPPSSFLVRDVRNCVGHHRIIDVMDVKTQKNIEMSMKEWCKYYESKNRAKLLNVISLEFSHTELDELVDSPFIVKLLDWVDIVWPKFLKQSQIESTNTIDKMKYPKVQKYCLMSVKGSYTDFHIDFGGTSVWYHILRGKKIFWMVPPTELNLQTFEEWTLSGMQQHVFFGDTVEECFRVELCAGNTFFIPSGWIHAVYTLEDSLVFGGNFLHSFGIENQLKVAKIEDATKVPLKFRYPFYTEMLWYVVQHYVYCLTGKDHLHKNSAVCSTTTSPNDKKQIVHTQSQQTAKISSKVVASAGSKKSIEDESTESEIEDSDTTTITTTTTSKKKQAQTVRAPKRAKPTARSPSKKSRYCDQSSDDDKNKDRQPDDDDESTEIDSDNQEAEVKPPAPTNTCRMTKNSLLRLQYEVVEPAAISKSNSSSKQASKNSNEGPSSTGNTSVAKPTTSEKCSTSTTIAQTNTSTKPPPPTATTSSLSSTAIAPKASGINFAEMMLSHETKLNGWSNPSGQKNTWSNLNSLEQNEPQKYHLTRYESSGLRALVKFLSKLSGAKKNLPSLIRNSRALLDDCRKLVTEHENDDPELAITGKPVTQELLHNTRRTDMNELIEQFFKSESDTKNGTNNNNNSASPVNATTATPTITAPMSAKAEKMLSFQQRIKLAQIMSLEDQQNKTSTTPTSSSTSAGTDATNNADATGHNKSNAKETKCLSPNKNKLSNLTSLSSSSLTTSTTTASHRTSSPPPRPKSPPTRPISNNQYTSKTKKDNNLLLPGSFADLIAATSTEKKVFDVSATDVNSSLFGFKPETSKLSPHKTSTSAKDRDKNCNSSSSISTTGASAHTHARTSNSSTSTHHEPTSTHSTHKPPGSPEPPKPAVPKRFINPAFRPQNKEKLIFASAPYVSPLHASEPVRSGNLYPWQTPHNVQQQQPQQQQHSSQPAVYSPATPRPQNPQHTSSSPLPSELAQPTSYVPDLKAVNLDQAMHTTGGLHKVDQDGPQPYHQHHHHNQQQVHHQQQQPHVQPPSRPGLGPTDAVRTNHTPQISRDVPTKVEPTAVQHKQQSTNESRTSDNLSYPEKKSLSTKVITSEREIKPMMSNTTTPTHQDKPASAYAQPSRLIGDNQTQETSKPTPKPRGPPKKSREAREAHDFAVPPAAGAALPCKNPNESQQLQQTPPTLTTTIRPQTGTTQVYIARPSIVDSMAVSTASPTNMSGSVRPLNHNFTTGFIPISQPTEAASSTATSVKQKSKRPKKSSKQASTQITDDTIPPTKSKTATLGTSSTTTVSKPPLPPTSAASATTTSAQQIAGKPMYGVVTPTSNPSGVLNSTGLAKMSSQPYLISRPLLFNALPTGFPTSQFQHLPHASMPLFTNPLAGQLGMPLQQGTRIVWTTPPRSMNPLTPGTTTTQSSNSGMPSTTAPLTPTTPTTLGHNHLFGPHLIAATSASPLSLAGAGLSTYTTTAGSARLAAIPRSLVTQHHQHLQHLQQQHQHLQQELPSPTPRLQTQQPLPNHNHHMSQSDNTALLSLATTALSGAALANSPALSQLGVRPAGTHALMVSSAPTNTSQAAYYTGQPLLRPFIPRMPLTHFVAPPTSVANGQLHRPPGQLVFARLPNQNQPRYLITQPGFMPQAFQSPHLMTSQPSSSNLAFAAIKQPVGPVDATKAMKNKKVKTS